jgi:hypothetical protein
VEQRSKKISTLISCNPIQTKCNWLTVLECLESSFLQLTLAWSSPICSQVDSSASFCTVCFCSSFGREECLSWHSTYTDSAWIPINWPTSFVRSSEKSPKIGLKPPSNQFPHKRILRCLKLTLLRLKIKSLLRSVIQTSKERNFAAC